MTTRTKTVPTKSVEDAATEAKQTVENLVKVGQDAATRNYEQVMSVARDQIEKTSQKFFRSYEELASFGKQNVDAVIQSQAIVAKGVEEMSRALIAFGQASLEVGVATGKAMIGVKTVRELVDLQTGFAKSSFDSLVAEGTKLSEIGVKVANEALEPINARVNAAVEKLSKPIAA
ncbi:phasin family protein [Arenibaculum pallidiluteum]|uniref:phasin family protein n=1 Tax=Arenibaculum pallidiluteum TaxID=2812559 RepID=UPI001A95FF69|nr:phasin family protein [Arenibaculum pallidiluteum]